MNSLQPDLCYVASMQAQRLLPLFLLAAFLPCNAQTVKSGEVAPGITLPPDGDATVFALDAGPSGPALVHIPPHEVVLATHAGSNFLRGMVYSGPHITAEVEGLHAETRLASDKAVFFVRISGEDAELMRSRVHLIWLQHSKKRREITDFSMNIFGGQRARNVDEVPSDTEMVAGTTWLRITPKDPLLPGEFAVAFMPKDVNMQPDSVFDFSVPGNPGNSSNPYAPKSTDNPGTK